VLGAGAEGADVGLRVSALPPSAAAPSTAQRYTQATLTCGKCVLTHGKSLLARGKSLLTHGNCLLTHDERELT
jgi:hypothetical protein